MQRKDEKLDRRVSERKDEKNVINSRIELKGMRRS
jgi:hypothetical protein